MLGPLEIPFFGVKEQKCLIGYITGNETLESQCPRLLNFRNRLNQPLSRNRDPNFTQNEYVYAICCQPEIADDVISSGNVKTVECCAVLNCEAAGFSSFRENQIQPFA